MADVKIYYSGNSYIEGMASRWDSQDYSVIFETWLKKVDLQLLRNNIRPGAVGELYNILGKPKYYDKTWTGDNTVRLVSSPGGDRSNLPYMRNDAILYVKNISDSPLPGDRGFINLKLEGYISGNVL
jgi:hypothetical protein